MWCTKQRNSGLDRKPGHFSSTSQDPSITQAYPKQWRNYQLEIIILNNLLWAHIMNSGIIIVSWATKKEKEWKLFKHLTFTSFYVSLTMEEWLQKTLWPIDSLFPFAVKPKWVPYDGPPLPPSVSPFLTLWGDADRPLPSHDSLTRTGKKTGRGLGVLDYCVLGCLFAYPKITACGTHQQDLSCSLCGPPSVDGEWTKSSHWWDINCPNIGSWPVEFGLTYLCLLLNINGQPIRGLECLVPVKFSLWSLICGRILIIGMDLALTLFLVSMG